MIRCRVMSSLFRHHLFLDHRVIVAVAISSCLLPWGELQKSQSVSRRSHDDTNCFYISSGESVTHYGSCCVQFHIEQQSDEQPCGYLKVQESHERRRQRSIGCG